MRERFEDAPIKGRCAGGRSRTQIETPNSHSRVLGPGGRGQGLAGPALSVMHRCEYGCGWWAVIAIHCSFTNSRLRHPRRSSPPRSPASLHSSSLIRPFLRRAVRSRPLRLPLLKMTRNCEVIISSSSLPSRKPLPWPTPWARSY